MVRKYYVPLVYVDIQPHQNANIPALEKTTRTVTAATYAVPLYKAKWGKAAKVTTRPLLPELNPYHAIFFRDEDEGAHPADIEIERLKKHFNTVKRDVFHEVYQDEMFRERFDSLAKQRNPWLEASEAAAAKAEEAATSIAAQQLVEGAAKVQATKAAARVRAEQVDTGDMHREIDDVSKAAMADLEESGELDGETAADPAPAEPVIPRRGPGRSKREKQPAEA